MKNIHLLKSTFILISTFFLINVASCQTKSKSQKGTKTKTVACAVKIEFGSPGTGIDYKTMDELKKMIEAKKVKYTETRQGKEGETQWCLPLTELKNADKTAFIEQLKTKASTGQLVLLSTN